MADSGTLYYRRYREGDDSAFTEIVRAYRDGLILYINGYVHNFAVAEELCEDVFVKLGVKKPKNFQTASFRTWLYTIGRNLAIDWLRKNTKHNQVGLSECEELSDGKNLEEAFLKSEERKNLHSALKQLKPEHRQVLWLIYFEGFTAKEASQVMKKSVHATEALVYRAKLALKAQLEKENSGGLKYENL